MALELDKIQLHELLSKFYDLTGFRVGLYDGAGNNIMVYPQELCRFCAVLRRNGQADAICRQTDATAFDKLRKTGELTLYQCGFGLTEALFSITEKDKMIGFMMIGQMLENTPEARNTVKSKCEPYLKNPTELDKLLSELPFLDSKKMEAAAYLFQICTEYLLLSKKIKEQKPKIAEQLKEFLYWNFRKEITVNDVCKQFGFSRTSLFLLMKKEFGCGLQSYVQLLRIEEAKRLITDSALPVKDIADFCGFHDPNYFIRLFKSVTGVTPKQYRNLVEI